MNDTARLADLPAEQSSHIALLKLLEGTSLTIQAKPPVQAANQPPPSTPPPGASLGTSSSSDSTGPRVTSDGQGKKGVREGLPYHGAPSGGTNVGQGGPFTNYRKCLLPLSLTMRPLVVSRTDRRERRDFCDRHVSSD